MDTKSSIIPQLGKTAKLIDHYLESQLNDAGIPLTKIQFIILMVINKHGGQHQGCLATLVGKDKTTFTRNISTLERKKLVERTMCIDDKRAKNVSITEAGRDYLELAKPIMTKIFKDFESDISTKEKEQFIHILNKIKLKLGNLSDSQLLKITE